MIKTKIRDGIILITDFSGFTEFVFNTKIYTGEFIVKELLSALIRANDGFFYISEIEGDAILFYKYRKHPRYRETVAVLERMQEAFDQKIAELNETLNTKIEMTLKFIIHYGQFSTYNIKRFKKLYGQAIVETHQLLKNQHAQRSAYILFSNSFLEAVEDRQYSLSQVKTAVPEVGMIYYQDV